LKEALGVSIRIPEQLDQQPFTQRISSTQTQQPPQQNLPAAV